MQDRDTYSLVVLDQCANIHDIMSIDVQARRFCIDYRTMTHVLGLVGT